MIVAIVVNGAPIDSVFLKAELAKVDYVIAVDGGMHHLDSVDILPNLLVGDLDSYDVTNKLHLTDVEVIKLPIEKDLSDLEFAIQTAKQRGATAVRLFNALGNRIDHTLTNFNVLIKAKQLGLTTELIDEQQRLIVADSSQTLNHIKGKIFSIVPLTDLVGVTIKGAKYPLKKQTVQRYSSLCLSNIATEDIVEITIEQGDAFIVINH